MEELMADPDPKAVTRKSQYCRKCETPRGVGAAGIGGSIQFGCLKTESEVDAAIGGGAGQRHTTLIASWPNMVVEGALRSRGLFFSCPSGPRYSPPQSSLCWWLDVIC